METVDSVIRREVSGDIDAVLFAGIVRQADGTELKLVQDGYGGYGEMNEDGEYAITELYKTDKLPDTLMVEAYDCMEKTFYGRFRVQLSK